MTTNQDAKRSSPPSSGVESSRDPLNRWLQLLRQRLTNSAARMLSRFLIVFGFLGCAYILGWGEIPNSPALIHYLALLVFPLFGIGLYSFSRQTKDHTLDWERWWKLLPLGFLLAALRHLTHSWLIALSVWSVAALSSVLFHFLRHRNYKLEAPLKKTIWDNLFLLVCLTNLFIPRAVFASIVAFTPLFLMVVFYNFILERDRLQRAKALAIGSPPENLRRANRLLPSSTYLFLLLPGLLLSEAFLFHAAYQTSNPAVNNKADPYVPPTLKDWLTFTVTTKMKAKFKPSAKKNLKGGGVVYREFGKGYSLPASLIRGFLVFFYAKRLLLIFLLLVETTLGIRVHSIGRIEGVPGAETRLQEQRQGLLRTLDSFPRAWSGFLLRGVQGKHGFLDPVGGILYGLKWFRSQLLPRFLPFMKPTEQPSEPAWSRLVREEQIAIMGQMQDRAWVLEAFIDLVSPAHSNSIRGKLYHHINVPVLRSLTQFYFKPPETEVRARIIHEMAALIQRAIETRQTRVLLSDTETELLTHEQVWTLRDRALVVLGDLVSSQELPIQIAAAQAITKVASLSRPVSYHNPQIWNKLSSQVKTQLESSLQATEKANSESTDESVATEAKEHVTGKSFAPSLQTSIEVDNSPVSEPSEETKREDTKQQPPQEEAFEERKLDEMQFPDPFAKWLRFEQGNEANDLVKALGSIGVHDSVQALTKAATNDDSMTAKFLESLGFGTKASGHPNAGFKLAQEHLLQRCQDEALSFEERHLALGSLIRLAFPYPVAIAYNQLQKHQQEYERRHRRLQENQKSLEKLEASYKNMSDEEQREQLSETYRQRNECFASYEKGGQILQQSIQDTFWTMMHYSAVVLISAYLKGEGLAHTPEFSDFLGKFSLEDPQGWSEFLSNLPPLQDPTSSYASYDVFCRWAGDIQQGAPSQQGMFQRFLEMKGSLNDSKVSKEIVYEWQKTHHFTSRYLGYLHECMMRWTSCLHHRPTLYLRLAEEASEQESWWRLTFTGISPWLHALVEAPSHVEEGQLYLAYEQFAPLQLAPMSQMAWHHRPNPETFSHGHIPSLSYWGYNFHRPPQLHLRQLDSEQDDGYWRSPEKLDGDNRWKQALHTLSSLQEHRPLHEVNWKYLLERSQASFQKVLSRSRLREQDALMIVRDFSRKLDHFLDSPGEEDVPSPSLFLLAGEAGTGHTTMLLQHARQQQQTLTETQGTLVFFLDAGLLEQADNLATWLHQELQIDEEDSHEQLHSQPMESLSQILTHLGTTLPEPSSVVLYLDGFHEKPTNGISLFVEAIQLAEASHSSFPWLSIVVSIRRSFLEAHIEHNALQQYVVEKQFTPPNSICYRDRSSVNGAIMELTPFAHQVAQGSLDGRSEIERAYQRYYNFTDTGGSPRYRPLLRNINELEKFGLTRSLLSHPALLPVVMETYHQRELPNDLHLIELFHEYSQQFRPPEQEFLQHLTRRMLYGTGNEQQPSKRPEDWLSDDLLEEKDLLTEPTLTEYFDTLKYGYSTYENLRSRGMLIRRWRTPHREGNSDETLLARRHVTFTSHQLQEYLLYRELKAIAPDWSALNAEEHFDSREEIPKEVDWLLQLAQHSQSFRPMEGALTLLLIDLLEHRQYSVVADFNDFSSKVNFNCYHFLLGAFQHISPQALNQVDGPIPRILQDLSENDLWLIEELGQSWKRKGLYQEADALYSLVLEHPKISSQLHQFPEHLTELLLEQADNHRRVLAQRSGGRLTQASYQEGRSYYQRALDRIEQNHPSPLTQARVLRFLALYEMDTNHLDDANQSLRRAHEWIESNDNETEGYEEQAWILHLQSALTRRQLEDDNSKPQDSPEQLRHAQTLAQEALSLALKSQTQGRTELLAQLYDNLARTQSYLAQAETDKPTKLARLQEAINSFEGSLQAKRTLNDFLGLAISYSGLGDAYQKRAELRSNTDGTPHETDWLTAKNMYEQGLAINRDQLQSDFGVALCHQSLASLYLLHPGHHTDGITELLEALLSFSRLNNRKGTQQILQKLVGEIASLPVHELYRLVQHIVSEIQLLQQQGEWLLEAFWKELQSVLGDSLPRIIRDFVSPFFSKNDSQPKERK